VDFLGEERGVTLDTKDLNAFPIFVPTVRNLLLVFTAGATVFLTPFFHTLLTNEGIRTFFNRFTFVYTRLENF
jgi:hypothetical protein